MQEFQQDGVLPHYTATEPDFLVEYFPHQYICSRFSSNYAQDRQINHHWTYFEDLRYRKVQARGKITPKIIRKVEQ